MSEEIKEILENVKKCCELTKDQSFVVYQRTDILKLLDYIQQKENIIKEVREVLNTNRVYISGERNLAFEIEQILDKENKC